MNVKIISQTMTITMFKLIIHNYVLYTLYLIGNKPNSKCKVIWKYFDHFAVRWGKLKILFCCLLTKCRKKRVGENEMNILNHRSLDVFHGSASFFGQ